MQSYFNDVIIKGGAQVSCVRKSEPAILKGSRSAAESAMSLQQTKRLPLAFADVREAMTRIREHVHHTPMMQCSHLDSLSGYKLHFKCEIFQKAGSFKIRGATNSIKKLCSSREEEEDGRKMNGGPIVVTHSSGNHAQAVALAARWCGVPAHIVMPRNSSSVKVQAVKGYGGIITFCEPTEQSRTETADGLLQSLGPRSALVPSSNHPDIMAGQGTIAMEMMEQVPDLDAIVGAVSVGGFMAGVCVAAKALKPDIKVYAAEPKNADDCARSIAAGRLIPNASPPQTVADALRMSVGDLTWPVLRTHLSGVVTVSEEEIVAAMRLVWERMKLVVEPAAACAVAAVLSEQFREMAGVDVRKVGVILCGGNVDLDRLPWMT